MAAANLLESWLVPVAAAPNAARSAGERVPGSAPAAPVTGTGGAPRPRGVPTGGAAGARRISAAVDGWKDDAGAITWRSCRDEPGICALADGAAGPVSDRLAVTGVAAPAVCVSRSAAGTVGERRACCAPGAGRPPTWWPILAAAGADHDLPIGSPVLRRTIPEPAIPLVGREYAEAAKKVADDGAPAAR